MMRNQMTAYPLTSPGDLVQRNGALGSADNSPVGRNYCARCRALDLEKMFDDSPLQIKANRDAEHKLMMRIGSITNDDENSPCPVCRFFAALRFNWTTSEGKSFHLWRVRLNYTKALNRLKNSSRLESQTGMVVTSISEAESLDWLNHYRTDYKGFLAPFESESHCLDLSVRRRSEFVDFGVLRSWVSNCQNGHDSCNRCESFEAVAVPVLVIDCDTSELCAASASTKYAALSYVWGNETRQTKALDSSVLPLDLPLLIRDAMLTTKALGMKYIWVDRYCLSESGQSLKHEQIRKMDLIYGRAQITLIALVDGPSCGFPGVSTGRSTSQPFLRVGDRNIIGTMCPPGFSIRESKWWTRAWTLQEAVLSRRRLYFTHEQAYFECRLMNHCETIEFQPTPEELSIGIHGPWGDFITHMDPKLSMKSLNTLLKTYFDRDMTYRADAINGFLGILQRYTQAEIPIRHYFGLPFRVSQKSNSPGAANEATSQPDAISRWFAFALTFSVRYATRRLEFPSWSWAGWCGYDISPYNEASSYPPYIDTDDSDARIWIERQEGNIQNLRDFYEENGLDLPVSAQSHFIWLEALTAQLKFISPTGDLVSLCPEPDKPTIPIVLSWSSGNEDERYYDWIIYWHLPIRQELKLYSNFMVLNLIRGRSLDSLLIVGERDGKKERVGCVYVSRRPDSKRDAKWFKERYNISQDTKLGSYDQIVWTRQKIRLG